MKCIGSLLLALLLLVSALTAHAGEDRHATRNVVLVTLDGVRTQEMFGGADIDVLRSRLANGRRLEDDPLYRRYWADTPQMRREKLMPFFWGTLMRQHGSIAGNAALGSRARVGNTMRFSYPGYAELLTGRAHDDVIDSNDDRRYPFPTVLEFVRGKLKLPRDKVAAFGSWDRFEVIPEHQAGSIFVNAGFMPYASRDPGIRRLDALQDDAFAWPEERFDAFTTAFAFDYLQRERPRMLYVALGDTDEWAHAGEYGLVLQSLQRTDAFLRELWTWLQSQPQYRDRTTLIVTTDHGRGVTSHDWTNHGPKVEGAQDIWIAIASPDDARRGEWRDGTPLRQGQVAATIAAAFGLDYSSGHPDADPAIVLSP
jgi:hypothetical protein